jgi:NADPH2:quinone reductase
MYRAVRDPGPELSKRLPEADKLDRVLGLVGNSVIVDSLSILPCYGRACIVGWLGSLAPVKDLNPWRK